MKKNGFTLVELLAVIVILGLIMTIVSSLVINIKKKANQKEVESLYSTIKNLGADVYLNKKEDNACYSATWLKKNGYLKSEVKELHKNEVVLRVLGEIDKLPKECEREIKDAIELTKNNKGLILNIAFNYGGRDEIVRAIKLIAEEYKDNKINIDDINSELVNNYLYTKDSPDPDLIIRPSGEQRLSNFLLWQCAYSEFWYSNVCWPDFTELDLQKAIYDYQNRDRRFGGV